MKKKVIGNATLYLGKMEDTISGIEHVDHILTDPPYLYIKSHDFDRPWDERLFFENAKRLLPDDGFIALFGRGTSFYRWNTLLAELGFVFKEEIIWNKHRTSGITKGVSRVHETISIFTRRCGKVKQCFIPYEEMREGNYKRIKQDVGRILGALKKSEGIKKLEKYLEIKCITFEKKRSCGYKIVGNFGNAEDTYCRVMKNIEEGIQEKSIIDLPRNIIKPVHPTEKPVRLAERILALISDPGDIIYDPFMGSGSFGVACLNTGRKYIGSEIKPEFFNIACKRIKEAVSENSLWQT